MIPRIREVHVRNYKSIAEAVVRLSDLTVLVGPNASGKSNFVDALAFVQECLSESVDRALSARGGIGRVRFRAAGPDEALGIRLVIDLDAVTTADYTFEVSTEGDRAFRVAKERCVVAHLEGPTHRFELHDGTFVEEVQGIRAQVEPDRLALYAASATPEFRKVYDFLSGIRSYRIDPGAMIDMIDPDPDLSLSFDGYNAASILNRLQYDPASSYERINNLLGLVVPGVEEVGTVNYRHLETVQFIEGGAEVLARDMSEGTLRLLGLLLAIYQPHTPSVLVFEEPEMGIHPGAAEVVMTVLLDAAKRTQVLVTTHSPDILDDKVVTDEMIRVVTKVEGRSVVAPVSDSSRRAIRERLYSPGELLRIDELNPDTSASASEANLFGPPARALGEAA